LKNIEAVQKFEQSSSNLTKWLIWLTAVLVFLTIVIACYTVVLARKESSVVERQPTPNPTTIDGERSGGSHLDSWRFSPNSVTDNVRTIEESSDGVPGS
jgi:hypothetical protein